MSDSAETTADKTVPPPPKKDAPKEDAPAEKETKLPTLGEKFKKYFKKHINYLLDKKETENMEDAEANEAAPAEANEAAPAEANEAAPAEKDKEEITKGGSVMFIGMMIFILVWLIASIDALVYSLMCFGYSGDTMEKVIGVVIAFFTGPFYFIYYKYSNTYCKALEGIGGRKRGGKKNLTGGLKPKGGRK